MKNRFLLLLLFFLCLSACGKSSTIDYWRSDSVKVMRLLKNASRMPRRTNFMVYFARQLRGLPYIPHTLDVHESERLVVNLRQFDCTTYIETVLAMTKCMDSGHHTFEEFCKFLRLVRYRDGIVDYPNRQHYFTYWIEQNVKKRLVVDLQEPIPPFAAIQTVKVNYMTAHSSKYSMLVKHPEWKALIKKMEDSISGSRHRYIPKGMLADNALLRKTICDGDIIAILTSKLGLDTSHIGIAVWHADGLHLLNASAIRHRVVEEPKLFSAYMAEHPSFIGIRVCRATK